MDIIKFRTMLNNSVTGKMIEYLEFFDEDEERPFTKDDVEKCGEILSRYLDSLAALTLPTDQQILECVKQAVLELNKLNEDTDYSMIETDERENIWNLIQTSAVECGLHNPIDDITEQWREW